MLKCRYSEQGRNHVQSTNNLAKQIKELIKHACVLGGCCCVILELISILVKFKPSNKSAKVIDVNAETKHLF